MKIISYDNNIVSFINEDSEEFSIKIKDLIEHDFSYMNMEESLVKELYLVFNKNNMKNKEEKSNLEVISQGLQLNRKIQLEINKHLNAINHHLEAINNLNNLIKGEWNPNPIGLEDMPELKICSLVQVDNKDNEGFNVDCNES